MLRDGEKLAKALAHSETVARTNKAVPYIKSWSSDHGRTAMSTTGPSVRLIAEEATYLRQAGQKVLVVKLRPLAPGVAPSPGRGRVCRIVAGELVRGRTSRRLATSQNDARRRLPTRCVKVRRAPFY